MSAHSVDGAHTRLKPRRTIALLLALVALCIALPAALIAIAVARAPWPAKGDITMEYPPNARQLIAAGLSARPALAFPPLPVVVDRVFVDPNGTTVVYSEPHVRGDDLGANMPSITVADEHGHVYRDNGADFGGSPLVPRGAVGLFGTFWSIAAVLLGHSFESGAARFAPLPATARMAVLHIIVRGHSAQIVRVPLRLAALRAAMTVPLAATVRRHGITLRLRSITRGFGSATLAYAVDTIVPGGPPPMLNDRIAGRTGHVYIPTFGHGSCGDAVAPARKLVPLHCEYSDTFAPPSRGTPLRLTISFSAGTAGHVLEALPGSDVSIWFRMP